MFDSIRKLQYFGILFILMTMVLPVFSAKADQIFAFSDDLSSNYRLNMSQTRAKISGGRAFTADDSVSSDVTSDIVANPSKVIISARVDVSDYIPSNARIIYYISNNNGQRWMQVNPGYTYLFDSVGNQLHWKAIITRESSRVESAYLDSVYLAYTVSDTLTVNQNNIYTNSGYNDSNVLNFGNDLNSFVCNALSLIGLGCGEVSPTIYVKSTQTVTPTLPMITTTVSNTSNDSEKNSGLIATIYNAGTKNKKDNGIDIILVRIPKHEEIYEIVGGKKHLIPTMDIFYDYGFKLELVQDITQKQLDKFPRIKLMQINGDKKKTYYFTEGGMMRLIPDKTVFGSYGDREEDIIVISKKEFNFYPQNQFVFLERPLKRDVFQIVNGKKRYVTPMAVERMKIKPSEIAPVNETELAYYKIGSPIIF